MLPKKKVCHSRRINRYRVFKNLAARGKTSMGWFYGFKLYLVASESGDILNTQLTPGNTDDRKPVEGLLSHLQGKVFADRGYVSQTLAKQLLEKFNISFFARLRRNMKNKLMRLTDKLLSRKRSIVETVIDQLMSLQV
ncbi:IS982 family transposase [Roseofilum reptotaenium CS-1145]|nr:IS982 family transposase [Roseofilum reptotaenium]MDB9515585.1 IS982 family transposase [Roseofilum reptotaenium CS-1145]